MAELRLPKGLIIDLITPLGAGGEIDGRSLGRHLDRVLPYAHGLFIASPYMGEGRAMEPGQREELLEKCLVVVQGRVPILVWISASTQEKSIDTLLLLKKRLETRKYTGPVFWVDTPLYYHSNRGLPRHYEEIFPLIDGSFILHNDPEFIKKIDSPFKRNNIRTSILKELALMPRIGGLIFSGSLDRAHNYQKAVRGRIDFRIYDGDEAHFLEHPSLSGIVSGGANLAPRAWRKITASSLDLNGEKADYPDHLKQIWDTGRYLTGLRGIYKAHGAPLLKRVLLDSGVIRDSFAYTAAGNLEVEKEALKKLMEEYEDPS